MKILSVDTCTGTCSVAISDGKKILSFEQNESVSRQAEILIPMITNAADEAGIKLNKLDLMATTIGPGSFTGARIGLSALKGIKAATNAPIFGISTLELAAHAAKVKFSPQEKYILVILDAKRGQLYSQKFQNNENLDNVDEPSMQNIDEFNINDESKDCYVVSSTKDILKIFPDINIVELNASEISSFVNNIKREAQDNLTPMYIRPPDAKIPS